MKTSANNCAPFKYYKYKSLYSDILVEYLSSSNFLFFGFFFHTFFSLFALQTSSSIKNKSVVFLSFCQRESRRKKKKGILASWRKENLIIEKFQLLNRNSAFKLKFANKQTRKKLNLCRNIF